MALSISAAAILEKNKLNGDGAFLILLEIVLDAQTTLYFVRNNEDIVWNGRTWTAFPFDLDDETEDSRGEIPTLKVKVSNVTRTIQYYVESTNGGVGATVRIRVVHSKHLDLTTPELEAEFEVVDVSTNALWVEFELGPGYPIMSRRPERRFLKNHCPFEYETGGECCVDPAKFVIYPTCGHTLADCRLRGNADRFGGEPTIPGGGIYV